ncbi:T1SS-143 repeat domain-containing protein [Photobacterium leiognathi]|uniref:T1SS-143 repeat domain-containing protein n=1 Tax=Photobacterium leiognathi TaxID=553611 RepID=UPI002981AE22|nr:Ig-like domain-containing protein [Photobacterium leiognathi]
MKPIMYIVVEGIIWKITDKGEWVQIPTSEVIDQSIPFIEERAYINDILKTKANQDDAPVIESSTHRTQFFLDANIDQDPLSSNSASFIAQIKATLAETIPSAGFSTRSTTTTENTLNTSIADAIPSLRASAALTASIIDGNDGYKSRFETPAATLLGNAIDIEDGRIVIVNVTDINGKVFTASAVVQNQKWVIRNQDLSELAEGELSIYASVTDFYGNVVDATDTTIKDTFAEINAKIDGKGDNYLNLSEITNSDLLGEINFVESDQPISITITDSQGKTLRFETINGGAAWQINDADLSSLAEGELTVLAETVDIAGNPASATSTIIKDTLATITADFEGNGDRFINQSEVSTTQLFGSIADIEDGQTITITVTDSQGLEKTFESTISAGKWTVNNANLTDLAEGELTVLAETSDIAGNPASATNTIIKDTVANIKTSVDGKGDEYLNLVETPITDLFGAVENIEDGQTVTITITDSSGADKIYTSTVNNGKWTVNDADLTSLAEGQLTVTTTATDIAGNTTSATDTITKDTLAEITANFEANGDSFLNKSEIDAKTPLFGDIDFVEDNQSVTVKVTDNNGKAITLTTSVINGAWQIDDIDLSTLADGELTVTAEVIDLAGNPASTTNTIIKDTLSSITANFDGKGDEYLNRDEISVTDLFGSVSNVEDGQTVTIKVTDSNGLEKSFETTVINGKWTVEDADLTDFVEGKLTVIAETVDLAGNTSSATNTIIKDTFTGISADFDGKGDEYLNRVEIPVTDLLGKIENVEDGQLVTITITDSNGLEKIYTSTVINGNWTVDNTDLTGLSEGELTVIADTVDIAGNQVSATDTIIKDTLATITADFEGNGDRFLNQAEVSTTQLFGSIADIEDGQTVTISVTDSQGLEKTFESTIRAGKWVVSNADLTDLAEGELTVLAETTDIAGNPASATNTIIKDTSANITTNFDGKGDEYLNLVETPISDLFGTVENIEDGQTVTITIADSSGAEKIYTTTINNGKWTVNDADLTTLAEGQLTITTTATDVAGNTTSATDTITKDTLAEITAHFEANGDSFLNKAEIDAKTTLFGDVDFVEDNQPVTVKVTDNNGKTITLTTSVINGAWQIDDADLSALADGELTVIAEVIDIAGNTKETSNTIIKDTSVLTIDIDTSSYQQGGLNVSALKNGQVPYLQGSTTGTQAGDKITVTFSDGVDTVSLTTSVDSSGNWRIDNIELPQLDPQQTWQMIATVTDTAGNTASDDMPTFASSSDMTFSEKALETESSIESSSTINIEFAEFTFNSAQTSLEQLTSNGKDVTVTISADGLTLTVQTATTTVLTAVIDPSTQTVKTTLSAAIDHSPGNPNTETVIFINGIQTDNDGTSETVIVPIEINIQDAAPEIVDDTSEVIEGNAVTGNVLTNDVDVDASLFVKSITINGETKALNNTPVTFDLPEGQFTIKSDGEWTFTANRNLNHSQGDINLVIDYVASDKDQYENNASLTISIKDGLVNVILDGNTQAVESVITAGSATYEGEFTVQAGADNPDPSTLTFNAQTITALEALALYSGISPSPLSYTISSDGKTITAKAGGDTIFTLSLSATASGDNATGTVTLVQHFPFNQQGLADAITLPLFIDAVDSDGTATPTGKFDWVIEDGANPVLAASAQLEFKETDLSNPSNQPNQSLQQTGTITVTIGSDGLNGTTDQSPLYFDLSQLPTGLTSGGETISYVISDDNQTIEARTSSGKVFEISLSSRPDAEANSTVDYIFTLHQALDQANVNDELIISIPVFIKDNDGDINQTAIDVVIVDGSAPVINTTSIEISETPMSASSTAGSSNQADATITVTAGQDPIVDLNLVLSGTVKSSDGNNITYQGQALTWQFDGSNTYNASLPDGTVIFSVHLSDIGAVPSGSAANATITVTLNESIDHTNGNDTELNLLLPVEAKDSDGSSSTSNVTVSILDGLVPSITANSNLNVHENDLLDDNLAADASTTSAPTLSFNQSSDELASVHLDIAQFNSQNYTSGGENITLSEADANGWYNATANGNDIFRIKVNLDGTVQFELFEAIDRPSSSSQGVLNLEFGAIATDRDGDVSATTPFEVTVTDDIPVAGPDEELAVVEGVDKTLRLLSRDVTGADGGEVVSIKYRGKEYPADGNPIDLINTQTDPHTKYGTISVNADGTVVINTIATDESSGEINDEFSYTVKDSDGDTAVRTKKLSFTDDPGRIEVNAEQILEDSMSNPLTIQVFLGDIDQNESLSTITISESSLAGGQLYLDGNLLTATNGVITLSDFISEGDFYKPNGELTYKPASDTAVNQQDTVVLEITATVSTNNQDKTLTKDLTIKVLPDADAATWDETKDYEYTAVEDDSNGIQLNVAADLQDTDGSETLKYRISGIPDGITLKLGNTIISDGKIINADQINDVKIFSDKHSAGTFTFTITAITTEKGNEFIDKTNDRTEESQRLITVNIIPEADAPQLSVKNLKGHEDQPINLSKAIIGKLADNDGSESLSYRIKVQDGWSIQGGDAVEEPADSGIYVVSAEYIENGQAQLHPKTDISSHTEKLTIEVTAISTEAAINGLSPSSSEIATSTESATKTISINLKGTIDRPDITDGGNGHWQYIASSTDNTTGFKGTIKGINGFYEDQPLPLDFLITTSDNDKSEEITILITNLPDGVKFIDIHGNPLNLEIVGKDASTGLIYRISHDQLTSTYLSIPKDISGNLAFDVNVISTEPDGASGEFNYKVDIEVLPVVDEQDGALLQSTGFEDQHISLLVEPTISKDSDNSEKLTGYKITNVPDGLTLFIDGVEVVIPANGLDLANYKGNQSWAEFINSGRVTILADEDLSGIFDITISYEVTDTSTSGQTASKNINATIQVDVAGVVETDTRLESTPDLLSSTDGSPIDLTNAVHFIDEDLDGSEYLDYIVIEVPVGINLIIDHPNGAHIDGSGNWIIPATGLTSDSIKEAMQDLLAGATVSASFNTEVIDLVVKARVVDGNDSRFLETPVQIQITGKTGDGGSCPPTEAPDKIQGDVIIAKEGEDINLSGLLNGDIDNNPEIALSFFIDVNDLPDNVEITGVGIITEYNDAGEIIGYTITENGLSNMTFIGLDEAWAGSLDIPITITQTSTCNGTKSTTTQHIKIDVVPVVDDIITTTNITSVLEDTATAINLTVLLGDSVSNGQTITGEGTSATGKETMNWMTITLEPGGELIGDSAIVTQNPDGSWQVLDPSRLDELLLKPPHNYSGDLTIKVETNITDRSDSISQTDTQTKTSSVIINVEPVTDIATMPDTITEQGDEDGYIHIVGLGAILFDDDGSETISLNLSGVPDGAVMFYSPDGGTTFIQLPNTGKSWNFESAQADSIYIRPPTDFSGDITLKLEAITNEIGTTEIITSTSEVIIGVNPVGDDIQVIGVPESLSGDEGKSFTIPIDIESTETNSNETLFLEVIFSAVDQTQLAGLDKIQIGDQEISIIKSGDIWLATAIINSSTLDQLTLFSGDAFGDINITLKASSIDTDTILGSEITHYGQAVEKNISLTLEPMPDAPELNLEYNSVIAKTETTIALNLELSMFNPAPNEQGSIIITGYPSDYVFSAGQAKGNGWEVAFDDIAELTMTSNSEQNFSLSIEPISTLDGQTAAGVMQTIDVSITDKNDNSLIGTSNDDVIIGTANNDNMTGGNGNDRFVFKAEDQGTSDNPAQDTIVDFDVTANSDNIDLRAILSSVTDGISAENYIDITENNGSVTLHIKDNGEDVSQAITLENVDKDALYGADTSFATEAEILQKMIDDNNLLAG